MRLNWAHVEVRLHRHVEQAAAIFGGVYIGIALPLSAQRQTGPGKTWDVLLQDGAPGSWGGHAVNVVQYDPEGLTVVTWGFLQRMTWRFWSTYVDEAWAVLPAEWQQTPPHIPGFQFAAFVRDLAAVGREES